MLTSRGYEAVAGGWLLAGALFLQTVSTFACLPFTSIHQPQGERPEAIQKLGFRRASWHRVDIPLALRALATEGGVICSLDSDPRTT